MTLNECMKIADAKEVKVRGEYSKLKPPNSGWLVTLELCLDDKEFIDLVVSTILDNKDTCEKFFDAFTKQLIKLGEKDAIAKDYYDFFTKYHIKLTEDFRFLQEGANLH